MAYLQQALADFGQEIGLELQGLSPSGEQQFHLSDGSLLGIVNGDGEAIIHLARPLAYDIAEVMLSVLKHAAAVCRADEAVQVGLRSTPAGQWLVLATRVREDEVSARRIREAYELLRQWLASMEVRL